MLKRFIAYYKPHKKIFICDMLASLIISAIGMIRTYNTSTTRPLPKLFDRTEV